MPLVLLAINVLVALEFTEYLPVWFVYSTGAHQFDERPQTGLADLSHRVERPCSGLPHDTATKIYCSRPKMCDGQVKSHLRVMGLLGRIVVIVLVENFDTSKCPAVDLRHLSDFRGHSPDWHLHCGLAEFDANQACLDCDANAHWLTGRLALETKGLRIPRNAYFSVVVLDGTRTEWPTRLRKAIETTTAGRALRNGAPIQLRFMLNLGAMFERTEWGDPIWFRSPMACSTMYPGSLQFIWPSKCVGRGHYHGIEPWSAPEEG